MPRLFAAALLTLLTTVSVAGMPGFSGASYVASTRATATVRAADDWTPPTVAVRAPATTVQGVVTLVADAADAISGLRDVVIQVAPVGGGWVTVCTATTSPYTCSWDTRPVADGGWSVRAVATDRAGYATTSPAVSTTVANNLVVVLTSPGEVVHGTVPLTATVGDAGSTAWSVRFEYAVAGTGTWKTLCTKSAAPYTCDWATTSFGNQTYDLRAVATSSSTSTVSAAIADVLVDNAPPAVTMQDPGSPLRGTVSFAAAATDGQSGVNRVTLQYATGGTATWTDLCPVTAQPWSCAYDTAMLKDGAYSFRAVATDVAGNSTTSTAVTNRVVDNTVSSVSLNDPGQYLSGTVTLSASASSTAGVVSVRIQRSPSGAAGWADVCTDTSAPYSCAWSTTSVADGSYDLRAVMVDGTGRTTTSVIVAARSVDNNPVRGVDVQVVPGGASLGKVDSGDRMTFLYSRQLNLGSVSPGWTGSSLAVSLRLRDGNLLGLGNKGDTADVLLNGAPVNLGSVHLGEDFVTTNKTAVLSATLTASVTTVNGTPATLLTLVVGGLSSGGGLHTVSVVSTMVWTPSSAATDLGARSASAAPVSETGAVDRDF